MDEATIGARLRILRRWRGMTQVQLAGLAGLSPSFVSMIENGQRPLDRRSHIAAIATALRVSETDLVGGPHLSADRQQSDPHMAIPALREALQTNTLTAPAVDRARPLTELAEAVTRAIEPARVRCDYTGAGQALPSVLDELHWHAAQAADETSRQLALGTLIEACVAATLIAKNLGYLDLAHVAALRAEEAAALLGDPVQQGKAALTRIWALPRERPSERKLTIIERAADTLEPHARTALGRQVLGLLTLHAALAAAIAQRPPLVSHWLGEASELAGRLPDDMAGNWQSFCRTNVGVWRVAISVERGESGGAVLALASAVEQDKIASRSRKAQFLADVGRGLAREPGTRTEAAQWLRRAERIGPQHIRNSAPARETVAYLLNRARADAGGRELRGMAARMGVTP
ncbi:MAG TPA: helix-turn-helix transcriptional regulator [Streptosporangiaceae bacterium]|nr:helix-turn-helix transcriptional regulator [Streptosporangiaceae bacterium]